MKEIALQVNLHKGILNLERSHNLEFKKEEKFHQKKQEKTISEATGNHFFPHIGRKGKTNKFNLGLKITILTLVLLF